MRKILVQLLGRTLLVVEEARHWRDGVRGEGDEALIDFWLYFDGLPAVHVCGDDDGERLLVTFDEPYASYDMGEYGEFRVASPRQTDLLWHYAGHQLVDAAVLGDRVGVLFRFDHRDLAVVERDDDFVLSDAAPAGLAVGDWLTTV
ncbi:hypothetical protein HC028_04710 [Planosporangium flavigriseum]|uniref:hypothetical protein n=1 Tax=Planosporangium flavigriseum TaxID=373681 RepID=UPI00143A0B22|nr:hypothetical protein [Planosporangium flavigriseum]NJC63810.1 hypothetical protein [Planosporangium flavigriseum]